MLYGDLFLIHAIGRIVLSSDSLMNYNYHYLYILKKSKWSRLHSKNCKFKNKEFNMSNSTINNRQYIIAI